MKRLRPSPMLALLCMLSLAAPAHAQSGLRLKEHSEGITLHAAENGLRLQFTRLAPEAAPAASGHKLDLSTRDSLRADWPLFSQNLHTTLGVSWNALSPRGGQSSSQASALNAVPFMGLGWQSALQSNSRWRLSAEIGTAFAAPRNCGGLVPACSAPANGFKPQSSGSGLRLNPYLNFGATFSFDQ